MSFLEFLALLGYANSMRLLGEMDPAQRTEIRINRKKKLEKKLIFYNYISQYTQLITF